MKKNILICMAFFTSFLIGGCNEALDYQDVIYFTGTEDSPVTKIYVDGPTSTNISVTSSKKMDQKLTVSIEVDEKLVDAYNAETGGVCKMLPTGSYVLEQNSITIDAGKSVSVPVKLEIISMDDFDEGVLYCVPLKITSNSLGLEVLEASRVQYILVNQVITTRGVNLKNSWYITMEGMKDDPTLNDLPQCTMEIRMLAKGWRTSGHMISSLLGVEENFLLRVGDVGIKVPNQVQLAGRGNSITAPTFLALDTWYHIAVVDNGSEMSIYINGELETSVESSGMKAINLGFYYNSYFAIGMSANDSRYFNGYVSEARVWRRALTPIELKNNQCFIDPATAEGLIGYWRLDEADGTTFKDISGNGYHGTASSAPTWTDDIKCPIVE